MTVNILQGNCLETLKTLPAESVQMVVTSPPYYGLRDYGTAEWDGGDPNCEHKVRINAATASSTLGGGKATTGHQKEGHRDVCPRCGAKRIDSQIGMETTPEAYVENLVAVFRECRRVLKDDGVLWLNLGDSYWGGKGQSSQAWSTEHQNRNTLQKAQHQITGKGETRPTDGKHPFIKPKDLIGIPWMVAFALRSDGWYLRQDIIWAKPNPMPESVTDRCTKSHEYIFLLSKSGQYFYDADAIKEKSAAESMATYKRNSSYAGDKPYAMKQGPRGSAYSFARKVNEQPGPGQPNQHRENRADVEYSEWRNKRDVWTVSTKPYKEAHFATFPPDLIEPCILAGTKEGDTVLDPFNGSGTSGEVSIKHNRHYIGCELNPDYVRLTKHRLSKVQPYLPEHSVNPTLRSRFTECEEQYL